jgi:SAM-dependent methyltransferase
MVKRTTLIWALLGLMVLLPAAVSTGKPVQNVILFGWDGAQRDHVKESLARKELPTLQKLIDEGTFVEIDIEGTTDTKAGWTQILTGYYPNMTGVYSNRKFQPIPKGLTVFERLEKHFGPDKFVSLAVIGKAAHVGAAEPKKIKVRKGTDGTGAGSKRAKKKKNADTDSEQTQPKKKRKPIGTIIEEDGVKYRSVPGQPFHLTKKSMDLFENALKLDQTVGERAMELIEKNKDKPFFLFVHFAEVDHSGHQHGENSKEYNDALISNDLWTGKIMAKVKELGLADKTQFYVTADHGFNEGGKGHSFAPYVFAVTNNKQVNRNGRRQDIAPTILEAYGLDIAKLEPKLDGISLTKPDNRPLIKLAPPKSVQKKRPKPRKPDVIYVPTPQDVVDKMLELAQVTKDDLVYDLGCGDGRIVVTAAKEFGCKAIGYDINPRRVKESLKNVQDNNVGHLVQIEQQDIFTLDLSQANVVTLYLLPELNVKLIPQLEKLKPGSRIVSHDFDMRGVQPDQVIEFSSDEDSGGHQIYLWTIPLKKVKE